MKSVSPEANLRFDGAARWQRPERRHLDAHRGFPPPVTTGDQLIDEAAPAGKLGEVARSAQDQGLVERDLQVVVVSLDGAVLMRLAGIVAAREHAVMGTEGLVALGDIGRGIGIEVPVSRREAVGAMFAGHPTEGPERVLEVLRQRREALPAEDHGGVLPTAVGQNEVIKAMLERLSRDRHAQLIGIGEVRQGHAARLGYLPEDHIAFRPVHGPPITDAPLQRAAHAVIRKGLRIAHLKVPQQGHGLNGRIALEDRQQHRFPHRLERVGHGAAPGGLSLRREAWIGVDTTGGAFAEPCTRGSSTLAMMKTVSHV